MSPWAQERKGASTIELREKVELSSTVHNSNMDQRPTMIAVR